MGFDSNNKEMKNKSITKDIIDNAVPINRLISTIAVKSI